MGTLMPVRGASGEAARSSSIHQFGSGASSSPTSGCRDSAQPLLEEPLIDAVRVPVTTWRRRSLLTRGGRSLAV